MLLLRLTFGLSMLLGHGWPKLMKLVGDGPVKFYDFMGLGPEISLGLAVFAEGRVRAADYNRYVSPRLASVPLIVTMLVAILGAHWGDPFGKYEKALLYPRPLHLPADRRPRMVFHRRPNPQNCLIVKRNKLFVMYYRNPRHTPLASTDRRRYLLTFCLTPMLLLLLLAGCTADDNQSAANAGYNIVEGETMGTYYRITYKDRTDEELKPTFDSVLRALNLEVSTYIPQSTISRFNAADSVFDLHTHPVESTEAHYDNTHFMNNYRKAIKVAQKTNGYFDPTVMPLVNYWGFGYTGKKDGKSRLL